MPSHISVFAGNRLYHKITPKKSSSEKVELRDYQKDAVSKWNGHFLCISPTGSGKSLTIVSKAAQNAAEGVSTFILVPTLAIAQSFDQTRNKRFVCTIDGKEYSLRSDSILEPSATNFKGKIDDTADILLQSREKGGESVFICFYKTFAMAYAKVRKKIKHDKIAVVIDEGHHASVDECNQNELGKLIRLLEKDKVRFAFFTATGYRADGSDFVPDNIPMTTYSRPLIQHYNEGYCPDLNIHFRFYDNVASSKYDDYDNSDNILKIDHPDLLVKAYVDEYLSKPNRPTLMIIQSRINSQRKITAAELCVKIEKELLKNGVSQDVIMNLGGLERDGICGLVADSSKYQSKLDELARRKQDGSIKVVIAVKVMDEGTDWPDCQAVFMARVPKSLPLIVQRIGRSLRKKNDRSLISDVFFFELGIKDDKNPKITKALVKTACRLKCLFHGLEFRETIAFGKTKKQRHEYREDLKTKLANCNHKDVENIFIQLQQLALNLDADEGIDYIILRTRELFNNINIVLRYDQALALLHTQGIINIPIKQIDVLDSFLKRSKGPIAFENFCKIALRMIIITGPRTYLEILSGFTEIDDIIKNWKLNQKCTSQNKSRLLQIAASGGERPSGATKLGHFLTFYISTNGRRQDPWFYSRINELRPDWILSSADKKKIVLLRMARNGMDRPKCGKEIGSLGNALTMYTSKSNQMYDPIFDAEIRISRPDWFTSNADRNKIELLRMAKSGEARPNSVKTAIGKALSWYTCPKSGSYDPVFDAEIRKLRPDWFVNTADKNKIELLRMAECGESKPAYHTKLAKLLYNYVNINSHLYDPMFSAKIRKLRPDWFKRFRG